MVKRKPFSLERKAKLSAIKKQMYLEGKLKGTFQKGHVPTPEMRAKMGGKLEKHYMWKGGITLDRPAYLKKWRTENWDRAKELVRLWKHNHRESANISLVNYRSRSRQAEGKFTLQEWEQKKKEYDYKCVACKQLKKLTIDHIIPISHGGSNWIINIQPLCEHCNYSKQAMPMDEFIRIKSLA